MKAILAVPVLLAVFAVAASAQLPHFEHIILVIQENRTPDNLFGGMIGTQYFVNGMDLQKAANAQPWCLGACFSPGHSHGDWKTTWNNGIWQNGQNACGVTLHADRCFPNNSVTYCNSQATPPLPNCPEQTYVDPGYDASVVIPYFDIAKKYGFANYFFQANQGPSYPAHQFLFSGTSAPSGTPGQTDYQYFASVNPSGQAGC